MPDLSNSSRRSFSRPCLAKSARLQIDPVTGKPVLLCQEAVIQINRTGYEILLQCDGTRRVADIVEELETRYSLAKTTLFREVSEYLEQIDLRGLLQWS
jgi:pyrroloquinoline quinone biosynthesis protein D